MIERTRLIALTTRTTLVGSWITVGALGWLVLSLVTGIVWPIVVLAAEGMAPLLLLPAWPIAVGALSRRHWVLGGVATALVVAHVFVLLPVFRHGSEPSWASTGTHVHVLSANVKADNPRPQDAVRALLAQTADVLVVLEATPRWVAQFERQNVSSIYPFQSLHPQRTGYGTAVYSKLPIEEIELADMNGTIVPHLRLTIGATTLDLLAVHTHSPYAQNRVSIWEHDLASLGRIADELPARSVMVGDFNASRWHPPFASLLDHGFTDAHLLTGNGLSRSWPNDRRVLPPLFRLDHALMRSGVTARSVHNVDVPGSDHTAFLADLVVRSTAG